MTYTGKKHERLIQVTGSLGADNPEATFEDTLKKVLKWAEQKLGQPLPEQAWKGEAFEKSLPSGSLDTVRVSLGDNAFYWAMDYRHPCGQVKDRVWSTEISFAHVPGSQPLFGLRLNAIAPDGSPSAPASPPRILREILNAPGVYSGGRQLSGVPLVVADQAETFKLIRMIEDPARSVPVILITLPAAVQGNLHGALLDPFRLAQQSHGTAHVVVVKQEAELSIYNKYGHGSAYNGGVKVYASGFRAADNRKLAADKEASSSRHALFTPQRIAAWKSGAAGFESFLRRLAFNESMDSTAMPVFDGQAGLSRRAG